VPRTQGHRFAIKPEDFLHPKLNIQYSLGEGGLEHNRQCGMFLRDAKTELPVLCTKQHLPCLFSLFEDLDCQGC